MWNGEFPKARKQSGFIAKDLHPHFNSYQSVYVFVNWNLFYVYVLGDNFREYAQPLTNIGAQFEKQHCKDLVMSRKVLSAKIMSDEYDKLKH